MSILLPGVWSHFPVVIHVYQKNSQTSGRIPKILPKILPKKSKRLIFWGSSAHFFALVLRYNFPRFRKFSKIRIDFYDQMRFFHFFIQHFTLSFIAKWEFLFCILYFLKFKIVYWLLFPNEIFPPFLTRTTICSITLMDKSVL